jgi:hypothetical protein
VQVVEIALTKFDIWKLPGKSTEVLIYQGMQGNPLSVKVQDYPHALTDSGNFEHLFLRSPKLLQIYLSAERFSTQPIFTACTFQQSVHPPH